MRPTIVDWLQIHGLGWLAWLVPTPGMVYSIMFIAAALLFLRRGRLAGMSESRMLEAAVAGAIGGALGTRLYYLLLTGDIVRVAGIDLFNPARGTGSWGAYLGTAAGLLLYTSFIKTSPWPYIDIAASCAPLATMIGRWSCFLAGDDFGRVATVPWAVIYPPASLPYDAHVARGLIDTTALASLPVHPNQLYLFLNASVVFAVVSWVWHHQRAIAGRTVALYFVTYGVTRFILNFFRAAEAGGPSGSLSSSQVMCLLLIATGTGLLIWQHRSGRLDAAAAGTA